MINLATERTTITALTKIDAKFIFELVNTPGWLQFIGDRKIGSPAEASDYIQKILSNPNINYFVVRLNEDLSPIGIVTFIKRDYLIFHDIGFAFLPNCSGKGFAFEATQKVLNHLKVTYPEILATTVPDNLKSILLLKKLKFSFEKEITFDNKPLHVYQLRHAF